MQSVGVEFVLPGFSHQDNAYEVTGLKGEHMIPIFVVIDEAFQFFVKDKSESYQQSVKLVNQLARLARFVGIHLIIATQRPDVDAIPPQIRSMLKTRVCFRLRQKEDSIMFVGSSAATELRDVPGRFLLAADDGTMSFTKYDTSALGVEYYYQSLS